MTAEDQPANMITLTHDEPSAVTIRIRIRELAADYRRQGIVLILYFASLICALYGSYLLRGAGELHRNRNVDWKLADPLLGSPLAFGFWPS